MASAMTDWGVSKYLSYCFGITATPAQVFCALASDDPGTDCDGSTLADLEPDPSTGYTRVPINLGASAWSAPSLDSTPYIASQLDLTFPSPTADWGVMSHFVLCDSLTAGNVFLYGEFDVAQDINTGVPFIIPAGGIVVAFGSFSPSIVAL